MGKGENDSTDAQVFTGARRYLVDHQNGCIQSQQMLDDQTDTTPTHLLQNMNNKIKSEYMSCGKSARNSTLGYSTRLKNLTSGTTHQILITSG